MTAFRAEVGLLTDEGLTTLYGEPVIYHCNHYNLFLQRTIEDADEYIPAADILTRGSVATVYPMLRRLFETHPDMREPQKRLDVASGIYSQLGFGLLPLEGLSEEGGVVRTPITHYSYAWPEYWGQRDKPVDYFTCGYVQAAVAAAFYNPPGYYAVEQEQCLSMGDAENTFAVTTNPDFTHVPVGSGTGVTIRDASGRQSVSTNVDAAAITSAIRGMPLEGDADGLIPAFGVYLTRHFANYYNYISYEAANAIAEATGEPEMGRDLFVEAGHMCAFHTWGGIMQSDEWYGLVEPQCRTREDWVSGIIAVSNAFGWGRYSVPELDPDKRIVLRVDGSYESNGYLRMYGKSPHPRSYLVTGAAAGVMNLLYFGDIMSKP
ncbi:MAG: hypothetical protein ABGY41_06595, partial [Candidatus Poribacteria bacterium]